MLFHLYVFLVIMLLIFNSHLCKYVLIDPPRWLYVVMLFLLQLTQLSLQLSTKISTIKNFQISYIYNENCYIQPCYIADTCTERVTNFPLSSGRHMHAWRAYFFRRLWVGSHSRSQRCHKWRTSSWIRRHLLFGL